MTTDEKLAAILAAVQVDPGNRGLARDPHDNLFTACPGDFAAACKSLADDPESALNIVTGFYVPTGRPPAFETDGPLGAIFLWRSFCKLIDHVDISAEARCLISIKAALKHLEHAFVSKRDRSNREFICTAEYPKKYDNYHVISVEHVGRATDGRYYSMRGRDVTEHTLPYDDDFLAPREHIECREIRLAIGDGSNEIGMGKIPHETIVKNIPNGDLIHCRVPADYLIVAGVSNWGAYALAAGVFVLRGEKPPSDLFDPDVEKRILEIMVREGPLVDGVTGEQTATVDGLTWNDYIQPMLKMREILEL